MIVKIEELIWLPQIVEKLAAKHGVDQGEVDDVFFHDAPEYYFMRKGLRANENVYVAVGCTQSGRYLSVFYIQKPERQALVVSARDAAAKERKRYAKKKPR